LSEKRTPDFVIGVTDNEGTPISWMVLDAKFRTSASSVRDSLKQIHIYRDSLRWNDIKPAGAYAIIPKVRDGAALYASDDYREKHNFGVLHCPLEPDNHWLRPVTDWLDSIL
jgi:hypothetical protein